MKKIYALLTFLILVGIFVPAVSALVMYDETHESYTFTGGKSQISPSYSGHLGGGNFNIIYFDDISQYQDISYIAFDFNSGIVSLTEGVHPMTYTYNGKQNTGTIHVSKTYDLLGQVKSSRAILYFNDWDTEGLEGFKTVTFDPSLVSSIAWDDVGDVTGTTNVRGIYLANIAYYITVSSGILFHNNILIEEIDSGHSIKTTLTRVINDIPTHSTLTVYNKNDQIIYQDYSSKNRERVDLTEDIKTVVLTSPNDEWVYNIESSDTGEDSVLVTLYIRNSQTGAAIANANIVIDALVNGEYHPVVNKTEPSGIFSVTLQPTGGGLPNPDIYRLIATADGYNNPMPEINFTVDDYKSSIYCYLDPIAGGPLDENKTFIDFFVRDLSANPLSGATVNFGGYTLITNSQGYTVFEIPKNADYSYTVSKPGYGPLTGNAVIGGEPRYTINTVIAPVVTPTTPTTIPTATPIGPKPTLTAPTGEHVSNWLEWFAAHFGMILGGGVEIGKIFMWLCFSVPVGVYVGKESKAGAAGFMAGAGIVTLFFVLIGWVPIWLLVLLALIIGLLYAKVFNNSDTGGGR